MTSSPTSAEHYRTGLDAILVRTGKYREDRLRESGIQPTRVVDSIADVPAYFVT